MLWWGFLITAAVMLVLAYIMMRSVTRPVHVLQQGVQRLSRRDFTPPEVLTTGDELEELSRAFRDMTLALKQYDEGQRRFLQNASHELKTPLMAIQGYAEGIRDGIFKGDDSDRVLDIISTESIRLKKLVDELIYLSKLETLEDMYNPQQVDLRELAEDAVTRLEALSLQKGVTIRFETQRSTIAMVDPDKLMQALINLLSNAIRHAHQTVTLRIEPLVDTGVRLIIADDGTGFSGEEQGRIFDRFFRGDKGETGLGLAITKAIIEKSGGSIKAHNSSSGGAVFTIELPGK
jgi:signal transduction histidine kinase